MGSGHALEAIRRLQDNRMLKQEQRSKYEQMRTAVSKVKSKYHNFTDKNNLSEKELLKLKRKIRIQIIKQKQKTILFSSLLSIIIIGLIFIISRFLFHYFINY